MRNFISYSSIYYFFAFVSNSVTFFEQVYQHFGIIKTLPHATLYRMELTPALFKTLLILSFGFVELWTNWSESLFHPSKRSNALNFIIRLVVCRRRQEKKKGTDLLVLRQCILYSCLQHFVATQFDNPIHFEVLCCNCAKLK